tara:strand:+ start:21507 stop:21761 length:255 start_codon:yes stop_codon:yes gene_type:complete
MELIHRKECKPTDKELKEIQREKEAKELLEKERFAILSMEMHESYYSETLAKDIVRVQSGWIYSDWDSEVGGTKNPVFVIDTRD